MRSSAFTTIELLIVISIIAILVALAAPPLGDAVMNARMTGQANELMTDLATARTEAVRRNVRTFICTSDNQATCTNSRWDRGWIIVADVNNDGVWDAGDTQVIKARPALDAGNTLSVGGDIVAPGGIRYVPYRPSGVSTPAGIVTFVMCDSRTEANVGSAAAEGKGRQITINTTGRAVVTPRTCSDANG